MHILTSSMPICNYISTLSVTLNSKLTLNKYVSSVCKSAYYLFTALSDITPILTSDTAKAVTVLLTQIHLHFRNSILVRASDSNITKLQQVEKSVATVLFQHNYNLAISILSELQWILLNKQINFKIATCMYESLAFGQPTSLLTCHQPQWSLRSLNHNL